MPITRNGETYLSGVEAQSFVCHTNDWLNRRVKSGHVKKYQVGDHKWPFYRQSELEALMNVSVMEEHEHLLTITELAQRLGVHRSYAARLVEDGAIEVVTISDGQGGDLRVTPAEYQRFVASRTARRQRRKARATA